MSFRSLRRWTLDIGRSAFSARMRIFDLSQFVREFLIEGLGARPFRSRFAITPMNKFHHVVKRSAGEENFIHAFASHYCGVILRDGAAAAAENLDIVRALFPQKIDDGR